MGLVRSAKCVQSEIVSYNREMIIWYQSSLHYLLYYKIVQWMFTVSKRQTLERGIRYTFRLHNLYGRKSCFWSLVSNLNTITPFMWAELIKTLLKKGVTWHCCFFVFLFYCFFFTWKKTQIWKHQGLYNKLVLKLDSSFNKKAHFKCGL